MSDWHQLSVKGHDSVVRAFLVGLACGLGDKGSAVLAADLDLEGESLAGRLRALFESHDHALVFAPAEFADRAAAALRDRGGDAGLELVDRHRVVGASFAFHAETFSPKAAAAIRQAMLGGLPEGVALEGVDESEERHPDSRGAELYAPEHEYAYRVGASVRGPFPGVLELHRRAHESELVEAGRITITTAEP